MLPDLLTVSMGWDSTPWHPSFSIWRLPPKDFRTACERAKAFMDSLPEDELGRRLVLLDNWNEFGEGHYIAPHRQYGFGYLDAVRSVFSDAAEPHVDIVPEDVGLGPYEEGYRRFVGQVEACAKRVVAEGGLEPGLLAWWTFDEADDEPVALDYSGHGLGGSVDKATRVRLGDRVVVQPQHACGRCYLCERGNYIHCEHNRDVLARGDGAEGGDGNRLFDLDACLAALEDG